MMEGDSMMKPESNGILKATGTPVKVGQEVTGWEERD